MNGHLDDPSISWTDIEWLLSAVGTVSTVATAFVWRMAMKVRVLENLLVESKEDRRMLREEIDALREGQEQLRRDLRHDMRDIVTPLLGQVTDVSRRVDRVIELLAIAERKAKWWS